MAEIFCVTLRTGSCVLQAVAIASTVGYATANNFYQLNQDATRNRDAKMNNFIYEQILSMKSECYNESGGIVTVDVTRVCASHVSPSQFN